MRNCKLNGVEKPLKLKDIGEKEIIRTIIKPLFNPDNLLNLAGDDCAVIENPSGYALSLTTDRIPADFISFKLGLINYFQLGKMLVAFNISDILSSGGIPIGLLLNLSFNEEFLLNDLEEILNGIKEACSEYDCKILGGDLSDSNEMNLSATAIGLNKGKILYRRQAKVGDLVYCSNFLGLACSALKYFMEVKAKGLNLLNTEEEFLLSQFISPKLKFRLSQELSKSNSRITAMDNTDGAGQTLLELSEINQLGIVIYPDQIPIHPISIRIASFLEVNPIDIALGFGADFQLIGTHESKSEIMNLKKNVDSQISIIGETIMKEGLWISHQEKLRAYVPEAWNYYKKEK